MAKNVSVRKVQYEGVPMVVIPKTDGSGIATFYDTEPATAAPEQVLQGETVFTGSGQITGTMRNNPAEEETISAVNGIYTIPEGYHDGTVQLAEAEKEKIVSGNIKAGVTVLGIPGKVSVVDTEDADAQPSSIIRGRTAYVNGAKVTGTFDSVSVTQDSNTIDTLFATTQV